MEHIHGFCDPRFKRLQDIFASNFEQGLEVGSVEEVRRMATIINPGRETEPGSMQERVASSLLPPVWEGMPCLSSEMPSAFNEIMRDLGPIER